LTSRRYAWRGYALEVEIPPSVASRARSLLPERLRPGMVARQRPHGPVLLDAPDVAIKRRDRQRALDFLRAPDLAGDGVSPSSALKADLARQTERQDGASTLEERVLVWPWYHTIELPGGIVTPGFHDHRDLVAHVGLGADLSGLRALDVATFDGFWAFELERRGAEVVAIDLPSVAELDLPTGVRQIVLNEGMDVPLGEPFRIAHAALGSAVKKEAMSAYDLDPEAVGTFDVAFMGDLLLHLERPLEALRRIRDVTTGQLIITDVFDPGITRSDDCLIRYRGAWNDLVWWEASLNVLVQMVADAGFSQVEVVGAYRLTTTLPDAARGLQRAIIHAKA